MLALGFALCKQGFYRDMYQLRVRKNIVLNYSSPHCGSASLSILMKLPDSG